MSVLNQLELVTEAQKSTPVNLTALARHLDVNIRHQAFDDNISGCIHKTEDGWEIVVNAKHPKTRQRFTLAHELGHFIYHRNRLGQGTNDTRAYRADPNAAFYNSDIERKHEVEANKFAAGLLMPIDQVVHAVRTTRLNDPAVLAPLFGVSPAAMQIRIEALGKRGLL